MVIGKFAEYVSDHGVIIQSKRLIEEMKVFVWKNGKAQAQPGYNDDLIMSFGIGMYIRDTALRFKEQGIEFKAIPNVGLTRMSDSDKMVKTKKTLPSYNKKVKKDMHRLRSVEYDELTADEQLCHNVNMSILNVLRCSTAGDGVNKVTKVIANNNKPERLALEETLKMFL